LIFPFFADRLEESPHWYEIHGRFADADAVLARIESRAGAETASFHPLPQVTYPASRETGYATLIARPYLPRTFMLAVIWTCQTLGFYGFMSWVPTLLIAHGVSLVQTLAWSSAMQLGAVPGALIGAVISDRWRRKWWIAITAVIIAFCGVTYGLTDLADVVVVFGFAVVMFIHTFAALLYSYTAECYPIESRNFGTGLTYGIGRLANVFGPLVVAFLFIHHGYTSVFLYLAACWVIVAAAVTFFGPTIEPQTRG
jgi:putative MFS transporter